MRWAVEAKTTTHKRVASVFFTIALYPYHYISLNYIYNWYPPKNPLVATFDDTPPLHLPFQAEAQKGCIYIYIIISTSIP